MDKTVELSKQPTIPMTWGVQKDQPLPISIGRFQIESLLAYGGMSLVYLAKDPKSQSICCVKVLSPHCMANKHLVDRFLKESEISGLTDHPNIVKILDQGTWENGLFIAMEFIQGISLRQFILDRSLSHQKAVQIVLDVASALLHLHTHGVIHRDLKPDNILITNQGEIKLIDFGIAHLVDEALEEARKVGGLIGTPSYMSPEQLHSPENATFADDIYSLGVIAYELCTGRLSHGKIRAELVDETLKPIIAKATAPRENRYTDIVEMIEDLLEWQKSDHGDHLSQMPPFLERAENLLYTFKTEWSASYFEMDATSQQAPMAAAWLHNDKGIVLMLAFLPKEVAPWKIAYLQGALELALSTMEAPESSFDRLIAFCKQNLQSEPALMIAHLVPQEKKMTVTGSDPWKLFHLPASTTTLNPYTLSHEPLFLSYDSQDIIHLLIQEKKAALSYEQLYQMSNLPPHLSCHSLYALFSKENGTYDSFTMSFLAL